MEAKFGSRLNRFVVSVESMEGEILAHLPSSSRLTEFLVPGATVFLNRMPITSKRKTRYDMILVDHDGQLVSVDSRIPPKLLIEAIDLGTIGEFTGYERIDTEVQFYESRLDLMLTGGPGRFYVETKSVTKVQAATAIFPDAATYRGTKHLGTLTRAIKQGDRAAVVFVIQRPDAVAFATSDLSDPVLAAALRSAMAVGVEAYAYTCDVTERNIWLDQSIPIVDYFEALGNA